MSKVGLLATAAAMPCGLVFASAGGVPAALQRGGDVMNRVRAAMAAEGPEARAIMARINAAAGSGTGGGDNTAALLRIEAAVDKMQREHAEKISEVEGALNASAATVAAMRLHGAGGGNSYPDDPDYTKTFASFFRKGDPAAEAAVRTANADGGSVGRISAALSEGSNSDGGYVAPIEWDRKVRASQVAKSPMRRVSQTQVTTRGAFSTLWTEPGIGSGWVGETASRPATATPAFAPLIFAAGEIYANPFATQTILDDADMDIEGWPADAVETEFNRQEGIAFISGDGVNKPYGLLQYVPGGAAATKHPAGTLGITPSGNASTLGTGAAASDMLLDFTYALAAPYRQNATWMMNSLTAAAIAKLKDGQGNYIWRESLIVGTPSTLLGRPVELNEDMPNIGADKFPIAFGDFQAGYLINDRKGIRILRDPYTNKPFVGFYTTKRVGGGVLDPRAIRLLKIAAA